MRRIICNAKTKFTMQTIMLYEGTEYVLSTSLQRAIRYGGGGGGGSGRSQRGACNERTNERVQPVARGCLMLCKVAGVLGNGLERYWMMGSSAWLQKEGMMGREGEEDPLGWRSEVLLVVWRVSVAHGCGGCAGRLLCISRSRRERISSSQSQPAVGRSGNVERTFLLLFGPRGSLDCTEPNVSLLSRCAHHAAARRWWWCRRRWLWTTYMDEEEEERGSVCVCVWIAGWSLFCIQRGKTGSCRVDVLSLHSLLYPGDVTQCTHFVCVFSWLSCFRYNGDYTLFFTHSPLFLRFCLCCYSVPWCVICYLSLSFTRARLSSNKLACLPVWFKHRVYAFIYGLLSVSSYYCAMFVCSFRLFTHTHTE